MMWNHVLRKQHARIRGVLFWKSVGGDKKIRDKKVSLVGEESNKH